MKTRKHTKQRRRRAAGRRVSGRAGKASPKTVSTVPVPVMAAEWHETSPFGPQSLWSTLLDERELLKTEIRHGAQFLNKWQKEVTDSWTAETEACSCSAEPGPLATARGPQSFPLPNQTMEQFLTRWVDRLRERLAAVTRQIEAPLPAGQAGHGDEALFQLLRGAG